MSSDPLSTQPDLRGSASVQETAGGRPVGARRRRAVLLLSLAALAIATSGAGGGDDRLALPDRDAGSAAVAVQTLRLASGGAGGSIRLGSSLVLPEVQIAGGGSVRLSPVGDARLLCDGQSRRLDVPLVVELSDSNGGSALLPVTLTTGRAGCAATDGDSPACVGSGWEAASASLRLVGSVKVPSGAGTLLDGQSIAYDLPIVLSVDDGEPADVRLERCFLGGDAPVEPVAAPESGTAQFWQVFNTSVLSLLGSERRFQAQSIGVGPATAPYNWKTLNNLVLPRTPLAFGEYIDFVQNGTAQGALDATGRVTLDLPLRLVDSSGDSQTFTAFLTTELTQGTNSDGSPICRRLPSDPTICSGTRRGPTGDFRMVSIVNIPQGGNTRGSGAVLYLEVFGNLPSSDGDSDGVQDASDNCPTVPNANQADQDADGVGDACDNCPTVGNPTQANNDSDLQGDACDSDDDNDEDPDGADNCPLIVNPTQANNDGDAQGDACDPDDDNDGVTDGADNCPLTSNASQTNGDGDLFGDACDTCPADPSNDADGDTICGNADNCAGVPNPTQANNDGDSLGDACDPDDDNDAVPDTSDNCPLVANPTQSNNDGDAQGDACDADDDNDAVPDTSDNCPFVANASQTNTDQDPQGDACDSDDDNDGRLDASDNCPLVPNPTQANNDGDGAGDACDSDDDNDGVADATDNCPLVSNSGQANADADAFGDACDPCPGDTTNDSDGDGICGNVDNCPANPNPDQADRDGDGIGDLCDPLRVNFQPTAAAIPAGYVKDDGAIFSAARTYGWDLALASRERTSPRPPELDTFVFTGAERSWTAEVPNGEYDVKVSVGDSSFAQGPNRVKVQGTVAINDLSTAANVFADATTRVSVRNGRLQLQAGGTNGTTALNYVEAIAASGIAGLRSINFQPAASTVPAGFQADSGLAFDPARGYGWSGSMNSRDRATATPQVLDTFVFTSALRTWEIVVPDGFYDVWIGLGDPSNPQGPHRVLLEGVVVVGNESTALGKFLERRTGARVTDGRLSVQIGGGGGTAVTTLNYLVLAPAAVDADGDGRSNLADNCPFVANPSQADGDGDGAGDACDPDRDGDGAENTSDNCPELPNASQADADGDRVGDACDPCPTDVLNDPDGDGVCGSVDNCPDVANPTQLDTDQDDLGDACDFLRVNYSPATAGTPAGFRRDEGAVFDATRTYGWNLAVQTRERVTPAPLELDTFAFTQALRTWTAELPNGDYDVRVSAGDAAYAQGPHRIAAQGTRVIHDVPTAAGAFAEGTLRVPVRDGRLTLQVGGLASITAIDFVEAVESASRPAILRSVNFQPAAAKRPKGFLADSGLAFDPARGYGWNGAVESRERGRPIPQVLDTFLFTTAIRTWEIAVPNGFYEVWTSVGDPSNPQGPQRLLAEGRLVVNNETTATNQFLERKTPVRVTDGLLSLVAGNGTNITALNYAVVATAPADVDGDGRPNESDNCPLDANPTQSDSNGNGIGDACDFDVDGDGIGDVVDNCPTTSNTDQLNTDGDAAGDACDSDDDNDSRLDGVDNCPTVANSNQADADGDGIGDVCDACRNDAQNDADRDGVCGNVDNCPATANSDQANTDGDTQGNACDADDDNDGTLDPSDNCPLNANPSQLNTDGDSQGDACDTDDDNDGLLDPSDNCPLQANPDQLNTDGDSQGNVCDADDDNDGVADASDNCPLNVNPDQLNSDGDAQGNACDTDDDNDGRVDGSDNCPLTANADQANLDGDSQGDVCDADDDNDGRPDGTDNCPRVANPDQADQDSDGMGNVCDVCANDATNDVDGDGICGNVDNCPSLVNPDQLNTDGDSQGNACDADDDNDGVPDASDNCPLLANATQTNTDGDSQGNACDADDDNDGVPDTSDNCPLNSNPTQTDTDGDRIGDVCDPCPAGIDTDGDGVCDATDNCPTLPNSNQANGDGDSRGDLCDNCPLISNNQLDTDNDGVGNVCDNCPSAGNPTQLNSDNDSLGNACDSDDDNDGISDTGDNCPLQANSNQANNDGDSLGDACDSDDDNDGVSDTGDNCPLTANSNQRDTDLDGRGDACDVEECDGLDNDGDNLVDEGFNVGAACTTGLGVCSRSGVRGCSVDGSASTCNAVAGPPTAPSDTTCNNLDEDCDGQTDEDFPSQPTSCGVGACARSGATSCVAGQVRDSCVAGVPATEVCNNIDDDCDNSVDEALPPVSCGVGECARTVTSCVAGVPQTCTPGPPTAETCNNRDDDCDGTVDDGLGSITCGVGACQRTVTACVGGAPNTCTPGTPSAESCNGIDDDCNGTTDEGLGSISCGVGACQNTVTACVGGAPNTCTPGTPSAEICNGIDDDCNDLIDDNCTP